MRCSCYHFFTLAVVLLAAINELVSAHIESAILRRLAHPSTISLEILPRRPSTVQPRSKTLRHDDTFRLILYAFDERFHLHLRPNEHLIHPAARIHYYTTTPDGRSQLTETKPLLRESVKAYWGEVIHEADTHSRLREDAATVAPRPQTDPSVLGWARIMVHHQGDVDAGIAPIYEGAFSVNGVIHHISTKDNYLRNKHPLDPEIAPPFVAVDSDLVIWRESDVMSPEELGTAKTQSCGHDRLSYNTDPSQNPILQKPLSSGWLSRPTLDLPPFSNSTLGLTRRDDVAGGGMTSNFAGSIGQTSGCPKTQKILYMGVAADCQFVSQYGSRDNATTQILNDWNTASTLYKTTFNVSLGIVELQIQDPVCPTTSNASIPWNVNCNITLNERLSLFSQWRGNKGDDGAGLWHLMSGCPTGTEVGIAWLATLCQQSSSGSDPSVVSGTAVSTSGRTEWQVIAHEIGHNFGAIHDCASGCNSTSGCCPLSSSSCDANSQFLMSPVAQVGEKTFSQCSLGNICSLMTGSGGSQTNTTCLVDPDANVKTITLQMCGNGIVEQGEDCDPGQGVTSPCCNSSTCKFKNGAVCDPLSSPCCTNQCGFAPSTQVCRPSKDPKCDTAEMCTGNSSSCPADIMAPNGQSCGDNGLACASGQCTSVSLQCQTVGGSMGLSQACPNRGDATCQISCQDPTQSNQCILLSSLLIDGSPCGYGGTCYQGQCQSGSLLDTAEAWYRQNLQIAIPVTVVAGLFILIILWLVIRNIMRCMQRSKRQHPPKSLTLHPNAAMHHERLASNDGPYSDMRRRHSGNPSPQIAGPSNSPSFPTGAPPPVHRSTRPGVLRSRHDHSNWVDDTLYNGPKGS